MTTQRANKTQSSVTCELDRRICWLTTSASWTALAGAAYDLGLLNTVHQLTSCTDSFQNNNEKSARRRHKHCLLAAVRWSQKFHPTADPFSGTRDAQNLISWRWSLPLPTNPVWWGSMPTILTYHGNTAPQIVCSVIIIKFADTLILLIFMHCRDVLLQVMLTCLHYFD